MKLAALSFFTTLDCILFTARRRASLVSVDNEVRVLLRKPTITRVISFRSISIEDFDVEMESGKLSKATAVVMVRVNNIRLASNEYVTSKAKFTFRDFMAVWLL